MLPHDSEDAATHEGLVGYREVDRLILWEAHCDAFYTCRGRGLGRRIVQEWVEQGSDALVKKLTSIQLRAWDSDTERFADPWGDGLRFRGGPFEEGPSVAYIFDIPRRRLELWREGVTTERGEAPPPPEPGLGLALVIPESRVIDALIAMEAPDRLWALYPGELSERQLLSLARAPWEQRLFAELDGGARRDKSEGTRANAAELLRRSYAEPQLAGDLTELAIQVASDAPTLRARYGLVRILARAEAKRWILGRARQTTDAVELDKIAAGSIGLPQVLANERCSAPLLARFAESDDPSLRRQARAQQRRRGWCTEIDHFRDGTLKERVGIAQSTEDVSTLDAVLTEASEAPVLAAACLNPKISTETISAILSKHEMVGLRLGAMISNPRGVFDAMTSAPWPAVRAAAGRHLRCPSPCLTSLANDRDREVRMAVAKRMMIPSEVLDVLQKDEDDEVRGLVRARLAARRDG